MSAEKQVVFVVGSGRSGTTLLQDLLCSHPGAAWVSNYSQRVPPLARLHPSTPRVFKGDARRPWNIRPVEGYRLFDWADRGEGAPSFDLNGELDEAHARAGVARRLGWAIAQHLAPRRTRFFVNKNTRNTRRVGYLAALAPRARFVHVVRNPLASVSSLLRVAFFPTLEVWWEGGRTVAELTNAGKDPVALAAEIWSRETAACRAALGRMEAERAVVVRYEDLVAAPASELARVYALAEVEPVAAGRAMSDRNASSLARLSRADVDTAWAIVGDLAGEYGYVAAGGAS